MVSGTAQSIDSGSNNANQVHSCASAAASSICQWACILTRRLIAALKVTTQTSQLQWASSDSSASQQQTYTRCSSIEKLACNAQLGADSPMHKGCKGANLPIAAPPPQCRQTSHASCHVATALHTPAHWQTGRCHSRGAHQSHTAPSTGPHWESYKLRSHA